VAEPRIQVEFTASFVERLESIETLLAEVDAPQAYDKLLDGLRRAVIPNLRRFPRVGRRYLDRPPRLFVAGCRWVLLMPWALLRGVAIR
jgi:plasmid stabilization system protein ParE